MEGLECLSNRDCLSTQFPLLQLYSLNRLLNALSSSGFPLPIAVCATIIQYSNKWFVS